MNKVKTILTDNKANIVKRSKLFAIVAIAIALILLTANVFMGAKKERVQLANKIEMLEKRLETKDEELTKAIEEKDATLSTITSDNEAKELALVEKDTEIKRLLDVQKSFEAHVVEIETELKAIKINFELYKKELGKDNTTTTPTAPTEPPKKP